VANITELLEKAHLGDKEAFEQVFPLLYGELRRLAQGYLRNEGPGHTLQGTALVHEVFLKLSSQERADFKNRQHFFAVAAQAMRRILVDHARKKRAAKRGHEVEVEFEERLMKPAFGVDEDYSELDEAMLKLEKLDARKVKVVEMRFFGGMTEEETAECLGISVATVQRDWVMARAWLFQELHPSA
jgi:RNA polymerase sigma-70 factor (ECF subfamily)